MERLPDSRERGAIDRDAGGHPTRETKELEEINSAVERGGHRDRFLIQYDGDTLALLTEEEEQGLVEGALIRGIYNSNIGRQS